MDKQKLNYYLQLADNAYILSHRLSEYCSHAPFLEEDLAIANVSLDLIGIAENIYVEAAKQLNDGTSADDLAYRREENEYLNTLMVEQANTDFAYITTRQFFSDAFNFYYYTFLVESEDQILSGIAQKAIKEISYHLRRSSEWMVRLGRGTKYSNLKMQKSIDDLWKFTADFFTETESEKKLLTNKISVDLKKVKEQWNQKITEVLYLSDLKKPSFEANVIGGKEGKHTECLGLILNDMQYLTNKYPSAVW